MKKILIIAIVSVIFSGCIKVEKKPYKAVFSNLKVTSWQKTDNGASWDLLDGPDVYFIMTPTGSLHSDFTFNNPISNADAATLSFLFDYTIYNTDFDKKVYIYLMDSDLTSDNELIGTASFTLNDYQDYPNNITIYGNDMTAILDVTWIYE